MTSPKDVPLTINGVVASRWIRDRRRALVDRVLSRLADPGSRRPDTDLPWIVGYNIDLFVRALEDPEARPVTEDDAADLVASAARRAGEGQPVENLMRDYQIGFDAVWQAVLEEVGNADADGLLRLTARTHAHLLAVTTLVLRGYHHEAASLSIGERDARYAAYTALLSGNDPAAEVSRAGLTLAERYLVLSIRLSESAAPGDVRPLVTRRRRANTIQRILAEHADGDVLAVVGEPVTTALVPVHAPAAATKAYDGLRVLAEVLDAEVHMGAALVPTAEIPTAASQCAEVTEIAVATRRPPGVYQLEDLLVDYQLTRPGPAFDLLLQRLSPLDSHPDWEETLRVYLRHHCDRRLTAAELHLHPNSVDYRLSRLADACGFDATDPAQRALAHTALCVRDVAEHRTRQRGVPA
ncbi:helix-turn-helix domain-containing protein [Streptomyces sp. NPDC008150]|uniref:PucR family transcriptional regulator n=1 Tax=Streptomyces sp. NPDC008150 TaxID=3364816 RepID=UPI0036E7956B